MKNNLLEKEQLYLKASDSYYTGNTIMTDAEYDELEQFLIDNNSKVVSKVGTKKNGGRKFKHPSRMLSLKKIKSQDNINLPYKEFQRWLNKIGTENIEFTPKYDGNSANIIYKNGELWKVLSRGDGITGIDITEKFKYLTPKEIQINDFIIEIRGEVLIKKKIFLEKYSEFKNPRNFVAGVLNSKTIDENIIKDLNFIPVDVRYIIDNIIIYRQNVGIADTKIFENYSKLYSINVDTINENNFNFIFNKMLNYRNNESEYQLDGFVAKVVDSDLRKKLGENDHDPEWALAIKYAPVETSTYIKNIEWCIGKTGEFTPVGILVGVSLDGSVVSRVSLNNYRYIVDNKTTPGAKITLIKAGDIIPQISGILEESKELIDKYIPKACPHCNTKLEIIDGIHLVCPNEDCSGKNFYKFLYGVEQLKFDFFGEKIIEKIFYNGITNVFDLFDKKKFNKKFLIDCGLPDGKNIKRLLEQRDEKKSIELREIIVAMAITGIGKRASVEIAKMVSGLDYSDFNFQKEFFIMFKSGTEIRNKLNSIIDNLNKNEVNIMKPEQEKTNGETKTFECTGSPKPYFATKEEFFNFAKDKDFSHISLIKGTDYLITDDYDSTSSKMVKAKKLGIEILSYEDFLEKFGK